MQRVLVENPIYNIAFLLLMFCLGVVLTVEITWIVELSFG
jgi:hypothetical protein